MVKFIKLYKEGHVMGIIYFIKKIFNYVVSQIKIVKDINETFTPFF